MLVLVLVLVFVLLLVLDLVLVLVMGAGVGVCAAAAGGCLGPPITRLAGEGHHPPGYTEARLLSGPPTMR